MDGAITENVLVRLGAPGKSGAFLEPHQLDAGKRIERLFEQAQMQPRLTARYDPTRTARETGRGGSDMSDFAADSRAKLSRVIGALPPDCAGVVLDVCGFNKGLQTIEIERGWPRRSAKLVLRIGLEQAARQFGLAPMASGPREGRVSAWVGPGGYPCDLS
jgi:hypothetical protein